MNKLYIVRHGKTKWNELKLLQGKTDIELDEDGINQAKELAKKINLEKIDICISSPLKRAKQTASLITNNKVQVIYDDLLLERGYGNYEGKPVNLDLLEKIWDYKLNYKEEKIESLHDCLDRAKQFIKKLNETYQNKNILIVSHGSLIKAIHFNLIGYNEDTNFLSFNPKNAEVHEYEIDN